MKMDVFCADIAESLDKDARIQNMKTFRNWNKDWQQPSKGVGPRGNAALEERLKKKFWGIKLIYKDKLFWIQFHKKKGKNGYYLILINKHYEMWCMPMWDKMLPHATPP
jgi:hypothetical protein